ncbi:MAG: PP2C family protein-serine/threonine phosphatase, partial [Planctomycetota bacterium]
NPRSCWFFADDFVAYHARMTAPGTTPGSTAPSARTVHGEPRVAEMVELVRELSAQTDAQKMVADFGDRFRRMFTYEGFVALSRRDLPAPKFRITRNSGWEKTINPWKQRDQLPVLEGGILGELLYGDLPVLNNDFVPDPADPAYEHIKDFRAFQAVPHYHEGVGTNMAINFATQPGAFDPNKLPDQVLTHNLFGRTTNNMVLSQQLREAHAALDAELKVVGDIQRSLLPQKLPDIPHLDLAAHYATAKRAGGDYYDLFPRADGRWGILIADVSGHGTPAAVVMAVTHAVAHTYAGPDASTTCEPCAMLGYINDRLAGRYDVNTVMFVTAWYGVYDPKTKTLDYAAAGHPPPRVCRGGELRLLDRAGGLPLGISPNARYDTATFQLQPGDELVMFTDGIAEAFNPERQQYTEQRLDDLLCQSPAERPPADTLRAVLDDVEAFAAGVPNDDDQTLLAVRVR